MDILINRRAVLISVGSFGSKSNPGDEELAALKSFLRGGVGGAWSDEELVVMLNPTRSDVLSEIEAAANADYCLMYVHGPGEYIHGDLPWPEARLNLSSSELVTESELNPGTPKYALLLDMTRHRSSLEDSHLKFNFGLPTLTEKPLHRYLGQVLGAEAGSVKIRRALTDTPSMEHWSVASALLLAAEQWLKTGKEMLTLPEAVVLARESLRHRSVDPSLEYLGGRRLRHFPFAVSL